MSPAKKKTKAAKSTARKAPARATAAGKKAATKPSTAKAARPKAPKATKSRAAKATKPKAPRAKTTSAKGTSAPAAAAEAPAAAPAQEAPSKRAPSRKDKKKPVHPPVSEVLPQRTPVAGEARSKLGAKWECFSCRAKFYDLNKPEPLCPRCGANQLDRPKTGAEVKPPPPRASRAMVPLLDEDEDAMLVNREELDLGVTGVDDFMDEDEPDDDSIDEEDDEP